MKFKNAKTEEEFRRAHPALQAAYFLIDDWSRHWGHPEVTITDVEDDGDIGRGPNSWHNRNRLCAADMRTFDLTPKQLERLVKHLETRYHAPMWELIHTKHGTGPHVHLARRDHTFTPTPKERG